jgi:hypothetical protein
MTEHVKRKLQDVWSTQAWLLLQHSSSENVAFSVQQFLTENSMAAFPHCYSLVLGPRSFKIKNAVTGRRVQGYRAMSIESQAVQKNVTKPELQTCFLLLQSALQPLVGFRPAQLSLSILSRKVFTECRCQRHVQPPTWRRTRDLERSLFRHKRPPASEATLANPAAESGTMGEKWPRILQKLATSTSLLGSFTWRKERHWADSFTSPPKEGVLRIFPDMLPAV